MFEGAGLESLLGHMSLFSLMPVFCMVCGKEHTTNFFSYEGEVCSKECNEELNWRKTLSTLGKPYAPMAELADATDSNPVTERREGSTPSRSK